MDENLPENWDTFFTSGGEVPAALQAEADAAEAAAAAAAEAAVADEAAAKAKAAEVTAVEAKVEEPVVPDLSQYEQVLKGIQEQNRLLQQQLDAVKASIPKTPEPQAPDPETDPLGNLNFQLKAIQKQINEFQSNTQKTQETQTQQTQMEKFISAVNGQVDQFKTTHADYTDAYNHLVKTRVADFMDRGMSQTDAREAVGREEMDIAAKAMQAGKNPAEVAYNMAKRYGYAAKAATEVKPDSKLDTIRKGIEATKEVEAGTPPEKLSLANLREADEKQLDRMVRDDWDGIFGKKSSVI